MAEDGRKQAFGIFPGQRKGIRVADSACDNAQQNLAVPGAIEIDHLDFEGLSCFPGNSRARLHRYRSPLVYP
jgi:hypothetical protein